MVISSTRCIDQNNNEYFIPVTSFEENGYTRVIIKKEDYKDAYRVDVLPQLMHSEGETGYYVLPIIESGVLIPLDDKTEYDVVNVQSLAMMGIKTPDKVLSIVIEGMSYEALCQHRCINGVHEAFFVVRLGEEHIDAYEDITVLVKEYDLNADYNEMAVFYRQYRYKNGLKSIVEKNRDAMNYAAESMEIRVRMGWKPVPAEVEYQTIENEPEMHVAVTFEKLIELMEKLHAEGVEKAQFCLVGWNKSGHDGRFPQLFPVEERLGGEEGLRKAIKRAKELGYRIVAHTNSSDAYSIADCFDEDKMVQTYDGKVGKGTTWAGGRLHFYCAVNALETTKKDLPKVRELGFEGTHYIDVLSIIRPYYCYHKDHPATRKDTALIWREMLKCAREIFGGCACEGIHDTVADELDFVLYAAFMNFTRRRGDFPYKVIPLAELVYHGALVYCPSSDLVNVGLVDRKLQLKFIEFGGRPAMYIYSRFVTESAGRGNWMGSDDLRLSTDEEMARTVRVLKETDEFYKPLKHLQYKKMVSHKVFDDTVKVTYEDGTRVLINYAPYPVTVDGFNIEALDYVIC